MQLIDFCVSGIWKSQKLVGNQTDFEIMYTILASVRPLNLVLSIPSSIAT